MDTKDILRKYSKKLEGDIQQDFLGGNRNVSKDYLRFKQDMMPSLSKYERWCRSLGGILKIKLSAKDEQKIQKQLDIAHLDVTPGQTLTLALMSLILSFFAGTAFSIGLFFVTGNFPILLLLLVLFVSLFLFYYTYSMPFKLANKWRLKASSQMVPCILYVVVYMKHTSNLERAVRFASQYLQAPLALDLRKVFWDVETGKFSTIKESLDSYLETWSKQSIEFIESFHLIESSLYEPSDERRIATLERALQVILDGVYENMLKYTREIRSPLTNLYMLGIILPTLGLALLPLASTLLGELLQWHHIFIIFNIIIPFLVFYLTTEIMLKRPGGYGESDILELNPLYGKYKSKTPYFRAFLLCFPLLVLGFLPFLFHYTALPELLGLQADYTLSELGINFLGDLKLFGFQEIEGDIVGPFGIGSVLLSLFVPLSIALFFSISYSSKTKDLIKSRDSTKQLEKEFTSSLFTLGNRLGDGTPAEIAFGKVARSSVGTKTEEFFETVNMNIQQAGMSLEQAIFNPRRGAIIYYPSNLVKMSMRILVESVKKGLEVAARSLMSISEYVKNIHKINERLNDLLAEIVSDMKSNMTFLAPLLSGIVVGLSSMITLILVKLQIMTEIGGGADLSAVGAGGIGDMLGIFDVTQMIPPYFLQIAIGVYIIQVIFILTGTLVTIDSGEDKLKRTYDIARNLKFGGIFYLLTALVSILALSVLAALSLPSG